LALLWVSIISWHPWHKFSTLSVICRRLRSRSTYNVVVCHVDKYLYEHCVVADKSTAELPRQAYVQLVCWGQLWWLLFKINHRSDNAAKLHNDSNSGTDLVGAGHYCVFQRVRHWKEKSAQQYPVSTPHPYFILSKPAHNIIIVVHQCHWEWPLTTDNLPGWRGGIRSKEVDGDLLRVMEDDELEEHVGLDGLMVKKLRKKMDGLSFLLHILLIALAPMFTAATVRLAWMESTITITRDIL